MWKPLSNNRLIRYDGNIIKVGLKEKGSKGNG